MDNPAQILVACSEIESRRALTTILKKEGYETVSASRVSEVKEALDSQNVGIVFCDRRLTDGNYRDVLGLTRLQQKPIKVVVTSRLADWDEYLEALHHGAFDLIASPCRPTDVLWSLIQARREEHERSSFVAPSASRARAASASPVSA
jgi:two-component system, NtrC family, response regulator HydG